MIVKKEVQDYITRFNTKLENIKKMKDVIAKSKINSGKDDLSIIKSLDSDTAR